MLDEPTWSRTLRPVGATTAPTFPNACKKLEELTTGWAKDWAIVAALVDD